MSQTFQSHLSKFIAIDDDEFAAILSFFQTQVVGKKENLLLEGNVCRFNYFVEKGILRKYFINEKGIEQTTEFAIEGWWMTETFSFLNQSASGFNIQAVESTEILSISRDAQDALLEQYPKMEKYFRQVYQRAYAAAQMRIKLLYDLSREELYHYFRKNQPGFLQRVPQYLIASYLNVTPEYLSEIRKKSIS